MPKLPAKVAKAAAKAEGGSFTPLDPGIYHVRLRDCKLKEGNAGPYLAWEFDVVEPDVKGRLWTNTSYSEKASFKLKETFDAFGVGTDEDTDNLIGKICRAQVTIATIQAGERKGDTTNSVKKLLPAADGFELSAEHEGDAVLDY